MARAVRVSRYSYGLLAQISKCESATPMISNTGHELSEPPLTRAVRIKIGSVEEVASRCQIAIKKLPSRALIGAPAPFSSKCHCAERQSADAQSTSSQCEICFRIHSGLKSDISIRNMQPGLRLANPRHKPCGADPG